MMFNNLNIIWDKSKNFILGKKSFKCYWSIIYFLETFSIFVAFNVINIINNKKKKFSSSSKKFQMHLEYQMFFVINNIFDTK